MKIPRWLPRVTRPWIKWTKNTAEEWERMTEEEKRIAFVCDILIVGVAVIVLTYFTHPNT